MGELRLRLAAAVALVALLAACSVSSPRNGSSVAAGAASQPGQVGGDGSPLTPGETLPADGSTSANTAGASAATGGVVTART